MNVTITDATLLQSELAPGMDTQVALLQTESGMREVVPATFGFNSVCAPMRAPTLPNPLSRHPTLFH
jgi:hypothetical protein